MKKVSLLLALILSVSVLFSACASPSRDESMNPGSMDVGDGNYGYGYDSPEGVVKDESTGSTVTGSGIYNDENNKVIRTANVTIQTTEFDAAVEALNQLTSQNGGYYETAQVESGGYYDQYANRSAYFIVRVPKENFDAFKEGAGGIGHVYSFSENTQDVGETYYDTEARLETLTVKRDRLLALLTEATEMEDIIYLEDALADVQYQIDSHTATLRKYDSLIGYSTFNIRVNEMEEIVDEPSVKESFGARLLASLKTGFANFAESMESFTLWFARNLMGIIIFAVVVVVVVLCLRRHFKRRRAARNKDE